MIDVCFRCYYLAMSYATNKQWPEVVALIKRSQEYVKQAQDALGKDKKEVSLNLQRKSQSISSSGLHCGL